VRRRRRRRRRGKDTHQPIKRGNKMKPKRVPAQPNRATSPPPNPEEMSNGREME